MEPVELKLGTKLYKLVCDNTAAYAYEGLGPDYAFWGFITTLTEIGADGNRYASTKVRFSRIVDMLWALANTYHVKSRRTAQLTVSKLRDEVDETDQDAYIAAILKCTVRRLRAKAGLPEDEPEAEAAEPGRGPLVPGSTAKPSE